MLPSDPQAYRHRLVIIGGGLAGLSCAHEASRQWERAYSGRPFEIYVIDKEPRLGGNSVKASSGINAVDGKEPDAVASFIKDTRLSGGGLSDDDLIQTLVTRSGAAIEFLESFGVELSGLTQLGGHSTSRTRFNPAGPNVGFAIMQKLMAAAESDPKIEIIKSAKVTGIEMLNNRHPRYDVLFSRETCKKLLSCHNEIVHPSRVDRAHVDTRAFVMATGGFGANKTLLEKFAPETAPYATTNGPWSTGCSSAVSTDRCDVFRVQGMVWNWEKSLERDWFTWKKCNCIQQASLIQKIQMQVLSRSLLHDAIHA